MCDSLVALGPVTAAGHTLFAKNSDRPAEEVQRVVELPSRVDSSAVQCTYVSVNPHHAPTHRIVGLQPSWMWGLEAGVNDQGVAIGNERIYTTIDPRRFPDALTGMDLVRLALERAGSAREAVDIVVSLLKRYGQGGSGFESRQSPYWSSFLIADPVNGFVVETSAREYAIENVWNTRAISNRTTIPEFDAAHHHPDVPCTERIDPRLALSRACLATRPITVDALTRHMRSHEGSDGWSICMHAETNHGPEVTTGSMIAELRSYGSRVLLCEGSPCTSTYREFTIGEPEATL